MKLVREHINEKFKEDSDPISDMGIGMMRQIKRWMKSKRHEFENKDQALILCSIYGKLDFAKYLLTIGANVHAEDDYALRRASYHGYVNVVKILLDAGADIHSENDYALRWASKNRHVDVVKVLKAHIAKEKKKKIKESINEKFTEDSDPISDMNIGHIRVIRDWMDKRNWKENIDYVIHDDLSVDITSWEDFHIKNGDLPPFKIRELNTNMYIPEHWYTSIRNYKLPAGLKIEKIGGDVYPDFDTWILNLDRQLGTKMRMYLSSYKKEDLWFIYKSEKNIGARFYDADTEDLTYEEWKNKVLKPLIMDGWHIFYENDDTGYVEIILVT